MILISFDKNKQSSSLTYTNLCINLITASWGLNIVFSLVIAFMEIYIKVKEYLSKKVKVADVTKITEIKIVNDNEDLKVESNI